MLSRRVLVVGLAALAALASLASLASCKQCDEPPDRRRDASSTAPVAVVAVDAGAPTDAGDAGVDAGGGEPEPYGDAGTSSCRLVYGPAEQPFRGPAVLSVVGSVLRLVTNDAGKPRIYPLPIGPLPAKGGTLAAPKPSTFIGVRWPPCELAGRYAYCQGPGGPIVRSLLGPEPDARGPVPESSKTIAQSRSGTRIAAAAIDAEHAVVAFLDRRHTTEGDMLQAFVAIDDRVPVRLSEEGAGATTVRFLPRAGGPVAVYLDTRTSMVPVHARPLALKDNALVLGTDAVVFVGGAPERGIDLTVTSAGTKSFALVPMPREAIDFGMAVVPIDDPPRDDVAATWSLYPNGIDPAPIAAARSRDGKSSFVARVRPRERALGSPRVLELGRVDEAGMFVSYGELGSGQGITDLALAEDGAGAVWIAYGSTTATWVERRACPALPGPT